MGNYATDRLIPTSPRPSPPSEGGEGGEGGAVAVVPKVPDVLGSVRGRVDLLQHELGKLPQADLPLHHFFTPGLYSREIFMPAGSMIVSRIHKTTHPFVISMGHVAVWTEEGGMVELRAPHTGITRPGTRRILYTFEDTIWTTFHVTPETDLDKLQEELTETPDVSYIAGFDDMQRVMGGGGVGLNTGQAKACTTNL